MRAAGAATLLVGLAVPAVPAAAAVTSPRPASGTPSLVKHAGPETENVRKLGKCDGVMYAVGRFGPISHGGTVQNLHNAFSFSAYAPYNLTGWRPDVNGQVNSITFSPDCRDAYIGGEFSSVDGHTTGPLAEVSTSTGSVVTGFRPGVSGQVNTVLLTGGHLLVGGTFSGAYYSLNPRTGRHDGFTSGLNINGSESGTGHTMIYGQFPNHRGTRLIVNGDFTHVAGQTRQQFFMLNLSGVKHTELTGWTTPDEFQHCARIESFYARGIAWSQNDSQVAVASTGIKLQGHTDPSGLCDAVAVLPTDWKSVPKLWTNYSGCDSFYAAAFPAGVVLAGGHERWADNPRGCNQAGPGAIPDVGLGGFNPANGHVLMDGSQSRYSMSRANADDMLVTGSGVWIASSNRYGSDQCDGVSGHAGICWIPVR